MRYGCSCVPLARSRCLRRTTFGCAICPCSRIREDASIFATLRSWWELRTDWEKTTLLIGSSVLLFVSVRVFVRPEAKTVYPIFSSSARLWWSGLALYEPQRPRWIQHSLRYQSKDQFAQQHWDSEEMLQEGYRYSPTFAVLFTPFALFPDALGGVLWRLFSAAALFGSLAWLVRSVLPQPLACDPFAWLILCCLPLSLQSINNGQANVIVVACMLGTVAAVREERWNLASVLMALAFVCKLYPLALGMLLIALYPRRLGWRIPACCAVSLLMPFCFQSPGYVVEQYGSWYEQLMADDRHLIDLEQAYRDLWLLIRLYDLPIPWKLYPLLQISAGGGIAFLSWYRQRNGWSERALLTSTLALASAWMMLLGPATESSSFVLLAPSFAWSVVEAVQNGASKRRPLLWVSVSLFTVAVFLGSFTKTVKIHALGVHSWATLLYFIYLLADSRGAEPRMAIPHGENSPGLEPPGTSPLLESLPDGRERQAA